MDSLLLKVRDIVLCLSVGGCANGHPDVVFTSRVVGCDYNWDDEGIENAKDACDSPGWAICSSADEARKNGLSAAACRYTTIFCDSRFQNF